jgi:hypothetical protein
MPLMHPFFQDFPSDKGDEKVNDKKVPHRERQRKTVINKRSVNGTGITKRVKKGEIYEIRVTPWYKWSQETRVGITSRWTI